MTDAQIKKVILKSHLRGEAKVVPWVREKLPHVSKEKIIEVLQTLRHDKYKLSKGETTKHYYYPIFTPFIGGFQIDLIQSSEKNPRAGGKRGEWWDPFWFVAINVNTRYAYAYPMKNKSADEILKCLNEWAAKVKGKIAYISCDNEAGWSGHAVENWLTQRKIKMKIINSDRHTALGIVDRFIRELRDMNAKSSKESGGADSSERKYRDFNVKRMNKLIDIHNTSVHSATEMTPAKMESSEKLQKEYIIKKVYEANRREKLSDFDLSIGTWVRFMIPKHMMKKHRYQFSDDIVQITGTEGRAYVCSTRNGEKMTFARWRLLAVSNPEKYNKLKEFPSIKKKR
jgi:hypothetical protein